MTGCPLVLLGEEGTAKSGGAGSTVTLVGEAGTEGLFLIGDGGGLTLDGLVLSTTSSLLFRETLLVMETKSFEKDIEVRVTDELLDIGLL